MTSVNLNTSPDPKSTCQLQATAAKADGSPAAGVKAVFKKPTLGSLSISQVTTDARGQAQVTYTASTEEQLAATGKKEMTVYIDASVPATGAKDTEAPKVSSLTGDMTASAEHEILPAHPDYYNRIEFRFKAAEKPDGSAYLARITASQQWGAFVKNIHELGGSRAYETDVWPNSDCAVYYHWTGSPSMMRAADEIFTIEIPEKKLRYEVTFSVGMDLRVVAFERKYDGALFPIMWEPFNVYIEDKFHPKADLEKLLEKFRIQTYLEMEQSAYEAASPDYSQGSLVSVLITRIEGLSCNSLQQAVIWDAGSWEVQKTKDNRYVLIQRGKYEDDSPWQEYPSIVFWERGTYRFQCTIKPGPFDADPRNNTLPSPSLEIEEFRGFSDEVIHTVFLPSLEFLAGASMSFAKKGTLLVVKTAFCCKGLTNDILAGDFASILIDAWWCALTGLDKANISQKIKDTFQLQELGTYVASITKGLYEQHVPEETHEKSGGGHTDSTTPVFTKGNTPFGSILKSAFEEAQGKEGALASGLSKAVLGEQDTGTRSDTESNQREGRFTLDDVLQVSQIAVTGMRDHYLVILQREGLEQCGARTSNGVQLTRAPSKLGPGNSPAERIEETSTTFVIPMPNSERLILEISGTGSHGQLITVTPQRIVRYDYPGGSWHSTVTVDSSGRATFGHGQAMQPTGELPAAPAQTPHEQPSSHAGTGGSFAGTWKSSFGTMSVKQEGNRIQGEYSHDGGKIQGTVEGNVVKGKWSEGPSYKPPKDAGEFEFTIAADGQSFKGRWRYGFGTGDWRSTWDGTRVE